jgi:hypothetical protein
MHRPHRTHRKTGKRQTLRWQRPFAATAALALSCQAVLGIEDLSEQPRPIGTGEAGAGNANGAAGSEPGHGDPNVAGSGGARSGLAGTSGNDAGAQPAGAGSSGGGALGGDGDWPDVALPEGGNGGVGGIARPDAGLPEPEPSETIVVSGHVIDFFRRPVRNVPVSIGGQTVQSGEDGSFEITGVQVPYDVSLMLTMTRQNTPARYGYVYEGLTRPDPTLQVYSALVQRASSSFEVTIENAAFEDEPLRRAIVGFSSPDGRFADESISNDLTSFVGGINWTGPVDIDGNVHALCIQASDGFDGSPPIAYEAHQAAPLHVEDGEVARVSLDLAPSDLPSDVIAGSITGGEESERENYVALRFDDGTALPLLDDASSAEAFTYLVPALPDTSLVVAAADGSAAFPPYALAWRDGLAPGDADVALAIPNTVKLSAPQSGARVDAETSFSWSTAGQSARTFLWHLESSGAFFEGMLVITQRTQIGLPEFPDGFTLLPGTPFVWSVETHGDAPDVDALAGPDGFLDPFSVGESFPVGPRRGGGYYTESARNEGSMSD